MKKLICLLAATMLAAMIGCTENLTVPSNTISTTEPVTESAVVESIISESIEMPEEQASTSEAGMTETPAQVSNIPTASLPTSTASTSPNNLTSIQTSSPAKSPDPPVTVTLSLDQNNITLDIGQSVTIHATVTPLIWESGEDSIATVNNGIVTARGYGAIAIIAKAGGKEQRCTVIVKKAVAQIDPQSYIDHAYSYGQQIGLIPDETLLGGSWNAWINLYSTLSEAQMKANIESGFNALKDEDRKYFKVYAEPQPDKSYRLFLYYG